MKRFPVLSAVLKRRTDTRSDDSLQSRSADGETSEPVDQVNVDASLGRQLSLITRLVGCSHKEMGRPFSEGKTRYRSCLKCGARRQFNEKTFETFGKFYLPPASTKNL